MGLRLASIVSLLFTVYTGMIFVRIVGSWFPSFSRTGVMRFVMFYTDPYLNLFRRLIPPIGGVLDLTPMIAFFVLQIAEQVILCILR